MRQFIHKTAILALFVVAAVSVISAIRSPLKGVTSVEQILHPILGIALWSFLIWKIWKHPRNWGLGIGIFLLFVIALQTYLWRLAIVKPDHGELGIALTAFGFIIYEIPLAVGAVCCTLLRWKAPDK